MKSKSGGAGWERGVEVRLSEVLPDARFIACDDIVGRRCCDDPDRCGPGDIFVARMNGLGDGHEEVAIAVANGVAGIVAEHMVATGGVPLCIVPDAAWALARLAHALAGDPAGQMRVIAITGTSGKTTTAWLAASVLAEAGLRVGVVSDLGCLDGDCPDLVDGGIEDAPMLAAWLERLAATGCTHAVVEVSSQLLAAHALAGVACDTVVVTNLAEAHLDLHGSQAAYHEIKSRIVDSLADDGCLIVNADDQRLRRLVRREAARRPDRVVIQAGLKRGDLTAIPVERSLHGQTVLMQAGGHTMPVAVSTPVASFVRDALLAAAIGLRYRVPLERIARGVEAAGSVSGRMERLDRGQDFATFLDRPTSGHALASTLAGLRRLTTGRLVVVAEERIAADLGGLSRFLTRAARWCEECIVAPDEIAADDADDAAIAAYARIDCLLAELGTDDCLLVLGDVLRTDSMPTDPIGQRLLLSTIVDGWLQLAHQPRAINGRRRAA